MNLKKHHTGIISRSIDRDAEVYRQLGYEAIGEKIVDEVQSNEVFFLRKEDDVIELIQPINENSTIKNARPGVHHICFEALDFDGVLEEIKAKRLGTMFAKFEKAPGLDDRRIAFVCLRTGAIIELLDS